MSVRMLHPEWEFRESEEILVSNVQSTERVVELCGTKMLISSHDYVAGKATFVAVPIALIKALLETAE